jgi:hypothetical protein
MRELIRRDLAGSGSGLIDVLSQPSSGGTEENNKNISL